MEDHPAYKTDESKNEREEILSLLHTAINHAHDQAVTYEAQTPEDERMQISWYRTLGYLSGQYRKLQKDTEIDEMDERLERLREVSGIRGD